MTTAPALTSELLDLMEHEKVIEQGIASMLDMAWAYERIRDGRKYQARGFSTWDDYCREWWHLSRRHIERIIDAAHAYQAITGPTGAVRPSVPPSGGERQLRPLAPLRDDPGEQKAAWDEAVEDAQTEAISKGVDKPFTVQPTPKQVEKAVAKRQPPKREHPAPFSDPILEQAARHLDEAGVTGTVLDPFAGTGRVHELRGRLGVTTLGVEIEPEWAARHRDTIQGDARELTNLVAPGSIDAIVTSPTYGNRMADHHDAKDDSVRLTYKHTLGRDLDPANSGQFQWGDEYRRFHEIVWTEAVAALTPHGILTLNLKNHIRDGTEQRVLEWHLRTLCGLGMEIIAIDAVPTRGLMAGANTDQRTSFEYVVTLAKDLP